MASTWSASVIDDRSASADSSPGSVSAVTSCPSARSVPATSSHAHAPSQKPGTRTIGDAMPGSLATGIELDRSADERLERVSVDLLALGDIDRAPDVPVEARVEELGRVFQRSALGERQ